MTLIHAYNGTDLTEAVQLSDEGGGFAASAVLGEAEIIQVTVDDPGGTRSFTGHKVWRVREAACASGNQVAWYGFVARKVITRGPYRTTVGRVWELTLAEANTYTVRRLLRAAVTTTSRPAETVSARLTWLMTTAGFSGLIVDHGLVAASSVMMDPFDYHATNGTSVLNDCALACGFNWYIRYREASNDFELIFLDFLTSVLDQSVVRISNVLADVDSATTWAANPEANVEQIPDRIASGIELPYSGGSVFGSDSATATAFASIDLVAPTATVKTGATGATLVTRLLAQHATEEEKITNLWLDVPIANLNDVKHGQMVQAKLTHGPGWESFRSARVTRKIFSRPENMTEERWRIGLELAPIGAAGGGGGVAEATHIRLERPNDNYLVSPYVWDLGWDFDGDNPQPGDPLAPKYGPINYYPVGAKPALGWEGIIATGAGVLSFSAYADSLGVVTGASSCTFTIAVNGGAVGTTIHSDSRSGLHVQGYEMTATASNIVIANGDIIKARMTFTGAWTGSFVIPSGTGNISHHLLATGSLVP